MPHLPAWLLHHHQVVALAGGVLHHIPLPLVKLPVRHQVGVGGLDTGLVEAARPGGASCLLQDITFCMVVWLRGG